MQSRTVDASQSRGECNKGEQRLEGHVGVEEGILLQKRDPSALRLSLAFVEPLYRC